jgi:hypothetical protein
MTAIGIIGSHSDEVSVIIISKIVSNLLSNVPLSENVLFGDVIYIDRIILNAAVDLIVFDVCSLFLVDRDMFSRV